MIRTVKKLLKNKNEVGRLSLSDSKTHYNVTVIKAMPYWHKIRQIDKWNRTERPQIFQRLYEHLTFDRVGIMNEWGKERFFNK